MVPNIHIEPMGKSHGQVLEEVLAVLVFAGMLTVSGDIGDRINERVAERRRLNNPLTGDMHG